MDHVSSEAVTDQSSTKSTGRERVFHNIKWIEQDGYHTLAVPGHSPFVFTSNPRDHILQVQSLDLNLEDSIPASISFDASQLSGIPQTPEFIRITIRGSLTTRLESWPNFSIEQSLAEGEPPGYPGINTLSPWEDEHMGWLRVWQGNRKLSARDSLAAGEIFIECCCLGMVDDPSQGGFQGNYVLQFDAFLTREGRRETFTSLRASLEIGRSGGV